MAEYKIQDGENVILNNFDKASRIIQEKLLSVIKERKEIFFTLKVESINNLDILDYLDNIIIYYICSDIKTLSNFKNIKSLNKTVLFKKIEKFNNLNMEDFDDIQKVEYSGDNITCDFLEVSKLSKFCIQHDIGFEFISTGNKFLYNGKIYNIPEDSKIEQAKRSGIDHISKRRLQKIHKHINCNKCNNLGFCKIGKNKCKKY
jgi:hypothetical protein